MANPYGIEQVDVPGILGAYDAARERRVQMMLAQNQLTQQNQQLDRETKLHAAYAKFRVPGADSGASAAVAAYGGPTPPATSASPAAVAAPDPNSPTDALASAPPAAAAPSAAPPAGPSHAGWVQSNASAIQDVMQVDPEKGLQAISSFHQLDADQQQQVAAHLDMADKVNEHALRLLPGVHDQASWDAARQDYAATFQQYGLPAPRLPDQYDPQMVHNLQLHALSVKDQLEAVKPIIMGADSAALDPITHQVIASNPKPKSLQHVVMPNGDAWNFDPESGTWSRAMQGAGASGASGTPGTVQRVHGYTPRASNGGDNSDVVVNNKISALSKAVGVDPDTPMTPEQFVSFVHALPATEGSGNNNPGGIKDGAYARSQPGYAGAVGQYAKFTTPEAGTAAMAKLLQNNYYDKGQRSIRDIIEGRPVGTASPSAPSGAAQINGAKPDEDVVLSGPALDRAAKIYNQFGTLPASIGRKGKNQTAIINRAADLAGGSDAVTQGANWAGAKADAASLRTLQTQADKVNASERTATMNGQLALQLAPSANVGNTPLFNRWVNAGRKGIGGDVALSKFDAAVKTFANEYANVVSVSTGNAVTSDTARQHASEMINSAMAPDQFRGVMDTLFKEMGNRSASMRQQVADIHGRLGAHATSAATPAANSGAPAVGEVRRGYRYKGGPPGSPTSWQKM